MIVAFIIIGLVFLCSYCNKGQRRVSHGVTTVMPVHPPPQPVQPPTYNSLMKNRRGTVVKPVFKRPYNTSSLFVFSDMWLLIAA